jgi:hypothetical protein
MLGLLFSELANDEDNKKIAPFLKDLEAIITETLPDVPYPAATDWSGAWLAFDQATHPYMDQIKCTAHAERQSQLGDRFWGKLVAAVEKQWPGKGILVRAGESITFDMHALIDLCSDNAGVKPDSKEAKEIAKAKKTIESVFGSGKLVLAMSRAGNMMNVRFSAAGVNPLSAAGPSGEERVAAALPETVSKRPAAVFYLSAYALARDAVLPIMAKTAKKKDAKQYKTMIQAMTPAEKNSALALACWIDSAGNGRTLLRITANELKNFGTAFNAFTAASLSDPAENE